MSGFFRRVNPARVTFTCDLNVDERPEAALVDTVIALAHDGLIDVLGDHEDQRASCPPERLLDWSSVEKAEGHIQRLPEASVYVVVDVSCVDYDADPKLPFRSTKGRQARVVVGQELIESGYRPVQQRHLERLLDGVDESQGAIPPVDEPVTMALVDPRRAKRSIEPLVKPGAELGLYGIGAGGGTLYVDRDDSPLLGQTHRKGRFRQDSLPGRTRSPAHGSPRKDETVSETPGGAGAPRMAAVEAMAIP
jgi:hypothetical protein